MTSVVLEIARLLRRRGGCAPSLLLAFFAAIGCGETSPELVVSQSPSAPRQAEFDVQARPLASASPSRSALDAEAVKHAALISLPPSFADSATTTDRTESSAAAAELIQLPPVATTTIDDAFRTHAEAENGTDDSAGDASLSAGPMLLAPQPLSEAFTEWQGDQPTSNGTTIQPSEAASTEPSDALPFVNAPPTDSATADSVLPARSELGELRPPIGHSEEDAALSPEAEELLADAGPTITGMPTGAMINEQARTKIRRGYYLAQRGAYFAARSEFIEVLRLIAEAKDQRHGASRRSIALANGLRALDEASDFVPRGAELETDLNLEMLVGSHRTPVAKGAATRLMPQQLADLYYRYSQMQLGGAVAGEPAGSMALHALGKLHSQIGRAEPDRIPQADRRAFSLQQAALLAREDNHLAAHELGVLLAETGHYVEAQYLLAQVAVREPHPVVYRNLARVQRKTGRENLAVASEQQARFLAEHGGQSVEGIVWVDPSSLARTGDPLAPSAPPRVAAGPPIPQPQPQAPTTTPQLTPVHNVTRLPGGYLR